jgi:hypothetical protein
MELNILVIWMKGEQVRCEVSARCISCQHSPNGLSITDVEGDGVLDSSPSCSTSQIDSGRPGHCANRSRDAMPQQRAEHIGALGWSAIACSFA